MPDQTRYARNGDATLAWTTVGDGPLDLLFVPGFVSHVEHFWEEPGLAAFFERLGRFARVIVLDRRGCGLSDPRTRALTLDDEAGDLLAVLDAAGSERAVLFGFTMGGAPAVRAATRSPARVQALVLYAAQVSMLGDDELPWANTVEQAEQLWAAMAEDWGSGANLEVLAPSRAGDPGMRAWLGRLERLSASPGEVRSMATTLGANDIRSDLPELNVPTLILHRTGDRMIDVRHSRYLAERIPGARYVELEGVDNLPSVGDSGAVLGEIEEFLTGGRSRTVERALLTVLFSDVVGSTAHAARLGDARWRELLTAHDAAVRRELDRFGGREVKTIGDSFLATFEGAPSRAVRCAAAIVEAAGALGLELRVGLHTGECEVIGDDVGGMAVHIAARVAGAARAGEVLASGTTYGTVVGSGLRFEDRAAARWTASRACGRSSRCADAGDPADRNLAPTVLVGGLKHRNRTNALSEAPAGQERPKEVPPMHARIRKALTPRSRGPWILVSSLLVALLITPFAFAFGEGKPLLGGKRSPSQDERRAYSSETEIIANTKTYGTRQSNKSDNGGGAIYGCRSKAGGTEKGNEPCIRANNLADGRAFEFAGDGSEVGRISTTNPNAAPFTTNAGGVATGLNADQVDGKSADEIVAAAQALNKFAAVSESGTLAAGRGAKAAARSAAGVYSVDFDSDVSKCARTATLTGATSGEVATDAADADTVTVRTFNSTGTDADRAFHLVVTC